MPTVEVLSPTEIAMRRAAILAEAGMGEGDLRARASNYELSAREAALLDEIDRLDWLAAEE